MKTAGILVVDDNDANVRILERLLTKNGFVNVMTTTDPYEALSLHESHEPDLLLLDLHMPTLDGFSVLERLKYRTSGEEYFPVLVLTADATPDAKYRALAGGAGDFVTKPFDHAEVLLRVRNMLRTRYMQLQLDSQNAILETRVRQRTRDLEEARGEVVDRLARAAEFRDDDTHQHTRRMAETCVRIAQGLGLTGTFIDTLRRAAPLHDVGKIGISDSILLKPGKLTTDEFDNIKTHTTMGAKILSGSRVGFLLLAEEIALNHHERWDGSGYPNGRAGESIPLSGRIAAIADVFDALTNERPYKRAWSVPDALEEMDRLRGTQFDPEILDAFLSLHEMAVRSVSNGAA